MERHDFQKVIQRSETNWNIFESNFFRQIVRSSPCKSQNDKECSLLYQKTENASGKAQDYLRANSKNKTEIVYNILSGKGKKRKIWSHQYVEVKLESLGLDSSVFRLSSVEYRNVIINLRKPNLYSDSYLDLRLFEDDWDFRVWYPRDLLLANQPLFGMACLPVDDSILACDSASNELQWQQVLVLDYDQESKKYIVRKLSKCITINETALESEYPTDLWVPRVYLKIEKERDNVFFRRIATAIINRLIVEESIRLSYYIDCMPINENPKWSKEDLDYIIATSRKRNLLKPRLQWIKEHLDVCVDEIHFTYQRNFNCFKYEDFSGQNVCLLDELRTSVPNQPRNHRKEEKVPANYLFAESLKNLKRLTLYNRKEVVQAMLSARESILSFNHKPLYSFPFKQLSTIDDFLNIQTWALDKSVEFIHHRWVMDTEKVIEENLEKCGKGDYSLNQRYKQLFEYARLKRLCTCINFMMEDVLRYSVIQSLTVFTSCFEEQFSNLWHVSTNFMWCGSFYSTSFAPTGQKPFFEVPLKIYENKIDCVGNLEEYRNVVMNLFDRGLQITKGIPAPVRFAVKKLLLYDDKEYLDSVSHLDPIVERQRLMLLSGLAKAFIVIKSYFCRFKNTLHHLNINPLAYIKNLVSKRIPWKKLKYIIKSHLEKGNKVSDVIPEFIDIGPFRLITKTVRNAAIKQHKQLADAILKYFFVFLNKSMIDIDDTFLILKQKIDQKTGNIEDLLHKKIWCKSVPKEIDALCIDIIQLKIDYAEISNSFAVGFEDDAFFRYWNMLQLPHDTFRLLEKTQNSFLMEENTHRENLLKNVYELKGNLKDLAAGILKITELSCTDNISEATNELLQLRQSLENCQELAALYNKHEALSNLNVTNFTGICDMPNALKECEKFWISYAEFTKYLTRDLSEVDLENLQVNINDYESNIRESFDYFFMAGNQNICETITDVLDKIEKFRQGRLT